MLILVNKAKEISECIALEDIPVLEELKVQNDKAIIKINEDISKGKKELENLAQKRDSLRKSNRRISAQIHSINENNAKELAFAIYPSVSKEQKEKVWRKAYEKGHSSGLHEVNNEFYDLMEIFD